MRLSENEWRVAISLDAGRERRAAALATAPRPPVPKKERLSGADYSGKMLIAGAELSTRARRPVMAQPP